MFIQFFGPITFRALSEINRAPPVTDEVTQDSCRKQRKIRNGATIAEWRSTGDWFNATSKNEPLYN